MFGGLTVHVGHGHQDREVEHLSSLFEADREFLPHLGGAEAQLGDGRVIDPALEKPLQRAAAFGLHGLAQVIGAGLLEPVLGVIAANASEERIVADQAPQHVQHRGALVVDQRAEHAALVLDVTQPIAEIHRPLVRVVYRPPPELPQDVAERVFAAPFAGKEGREVLREALAQPLFVMVLPAHGLPEPLVRQFVRHEEFWKA